MPGQQEHSQRLIKDRAGIVAKNSLNILSDIAPRSQFERIENAQSVHDLLTLLREAFYGALSPKEIAQMEEENIAVENLDWIKQETKYQTRIEYFLEYLEAFVAKVEFYTLEDVAEVLNRELMLLKVKYSDYSEEFDAIVSKIEGRLTQIHTDLVAQRLAKVRPGDLAKGINFSERWFAYFVYESIIKDESSPLAAIIIRMLSSDELWSEKEYSVSDLANDIKQRPIGFVQAFARFWNRLGEESK